MFEAYIINIVASISLGEFKKLINKDARSEINEVVSKVIKSLIKNKGIREKEEKKVKEFLINYSENPDGFGDVEKGEYGKFLKKFYEILPCYQMASNFISEQNDQKRFEILKEKFEILEEKFEILEEKTEQKYHTEITDQKAFNFISEQNNQKRFEILKEKIEQKYDTKVTNLENTISNLNELRDYDKNKIGALANKIEQLEKEKKNHLEQLDSIRKSNLNIDEKLHKEALELFLQDKIDQSLEKLEEKILIEEEERNRNRNKELQEESKKLAKRRIFKARLYAIKFNFKKAIFNFEKAIKIDSSPENLFEFAKFLQELNYLDLSKSSYEEALKIYRERAKENPRTYLADVAATLNNLANLHSDKNEFPQALEKYEEALKIYRELAKENPRTYLADVAATLNNLANLHSDKNEFPQALEKYEEALKIYRERAKENSRTYLPYVATTLNNLAVLHSAKNEFPQALEKHEEALKIRRELAKENPRTYEINYARSLLMGVCFFNKDHNDLIRSKEILLKYKGIPAADDLLEIIDEIEKG